MVFMKKGCRYLSILIILLVFVSIVQSATKTVELGPAADTDIRQAAPDYALGTRTDHYVCNISGNSGKLYMRFELPEDIYSVTGATLKLVRTRLNGSYNLYYNVYGLKDSAAGQSWPENNTTWNNAPANDTASGNGFTSDATGLLGEFMCPNPGVLGSEHTVSNDDLVSFINSDTDRVITFMVSRHNTTSSFDTFASKENGSYTEPKLEITYETATLKEVTLSAIADADVREEVPDYAVGYRDEHLCKNEAAGYRAKVYFKFELPADVDTIKSAEFLITPTTLANSLWYLDYNIHGLNDGAGGNDWQDLSPGTYYGAPSGGITWNNAPANDQSSGDGFTSDATGVLTSFTRTDPVYTEHSADSTPEFLSFLQSDTDGTVTLMMARTNTDTNSSDLFASRENDGNEPPKLHIQYARKVDVNQVDIFATADSDIRSNAPDYAKGNREEHAIYYQWDFDNSHLYVRFDLPEDFRVASDAVFKITSADSISNWEYQVYGLNDDVAGNDWQDLSPGDYYGSPSGGLTWNNAPGNDTTENNSLISSETTLLGVMTEIGDYIETSFSNSSLVDFINGDSDKKITLILARNEGQQSYNSTFVSKENATYAGPLLELTYKVACGIELAADLNGDCYIDVQDLGLFAEEWLTNTAP